MKTTTHSHGPVLLGLSLAFGVVLGVPGCDAMDDTQARSIEGDTDDTEGTTGAPGTTGEPGDDGCTLTQGYWKNHGNWPIEAGAEMCGQTWLEILKTPPKGDAWYILAHQWIAAKLNVASGAVPPLEVADAIAQAGVYLQDCEISKAEKADALALSGLLDDFNNGNAGPAHCDDGDGGDDTTTGADATTGDDTGGDTCGDTHDGGSSSTGDVWPIPG